MSHMIKVSVKELEQLKKDAIKLAALEAGGVDNWKYYDDAMKVIREKEELVEKRCELLDELEVIFGECSYELTERGAGIAFYETVRPNSLRLLDRMGVIFK